MPTPAPSRPTSNGPAGARPVILVLAGVCAVGAVLIALGIPRLDWLSGGDAARPGAARGDAPGGPGALAREGGTAGVAGAGGRAPGAGPGRALSLDDFVGSGVVGGGTLSPEEEERLLAEVANLAAAEAYEIGTRAEAENDFRLAYAAFKHALTLEPDNFEYLHGAARMAKMLTRPDEALAWLEHALEIGEQTFGSDDPRVGGTLTQLGLVHFQKQNPDEAGSYLERALALAERNSGYMSPEAAEVMTYLAWHYQGQGDLAEARRLYESALAVAEDLGDAPATAARLKDVGMLYYAEGRYDEALEILERSAEIRREEFGDGREVADSYRNIGLIHLGKGDPVTAEAYVRRALEMEKEKLGPTHPDVASSLESLALVYQLQGRGLEAQLAYQEAIEIQQAAFGSVNPKVALNINNLAMTFQNLGQNDLAENAYQWALSVSTETVGKTHSNTRSIVERYASFLRSRGRSREAQRLERSYDDG